MDVKDVMQRHPPVVESTDTLAMAKQMMLWSACRYLPVLDDGKLVGVLSEHDILRFMGSRANTPEAEVGRAMTSPAQTAHPDESADLAALRMTDGELGCLPVVARGRLVGILTRTDLLAAEAARSLQTPRPLRAMVAKQIMTPDPKAVYATDPVLAAVRSMSVYGIRHLLVTDEHGHLEGIVSDRDVRIQQELWGIIEPQTSMVSSVMTRDVVTVGPDEPIETVVAALADWRIGALPVVDETKRVLGIISYVDVLSALADRIHNA